MSFSADEKEHSPFTNSPAANDGETAYNDYDEIDDFEEDGKEYYSDDSANEDANDVYEDSDDDEVEEEVEEEEFTDSESRDNLDTARSISLFPEAAAESSHTESEAEGEEVFSLPHTSSLQQHLLTIQPELATSNVNLRMTDLTSKAHARYRNQQHAHRDDTEDGDDPFLESALHGHKKRKHGHRGRPRKVDHGFGNSTTHLLPPNISKMMGSANVAYVGRRYAEAITLLLEVIRRAPHAFEAYHTLALIHEERGEYDLAISYLVIAAHLNRASCIDQWSKLVSLTLTLGRRREAIYYMGRLLRKGASVLDASLWWQRAKMMVEEGNPRGAILQFSRLLHRDWKSVDVWRRLWLLGQRLCLVDCVISMMKQTLCPNQEGRARMVGSSNVDDKDPPTSTPPSQSRNQISTTIQLDQESHESLHFCLSALLERREYPCVHGLIETVAINYAPRINISTDWFLLSDDVRLGRIISMLPLHFRLLYAIAALHLGHIPSVPELKSVVGGGQESISQNSALLRRLAMCLLACARAGEALILLLALMGVPNEANVDLCKAIGDAYRLMDGHQQMAIDTYEAILEIDPMRADIRTTLHELYKSSIGSDADSALGWEQKAKSVLLMPNGMVVGGGGGGGDDDDAIASVTKGADGERDKFAVADSSLSCADGRGGLDVHRIFDGIFSSPQQDGHASPAAKRGPCGSDGDAALSSSLLNLPASQMSKQHQKRLEGKRKRLRRPQKLTSYSALQCQAVQQDYSRIIQLYTARTLITLRQAHQLSKSLLADMLSNPSLRPSEGNRPPSKSTDISLMHGLSLQEWFEFLCMAIDLECLVGGGGKAVALLKSILNKHLLWMSREAHVLLRLMQAKLCVGQGRPAAVLSSCRWWIRCMPDNPFTLQLCMYAINTLPATALQGSFARFLQRVSFRPSSRPAQVLAYLNVCLALDRIDASINCCYKLLLDCLHPAKSPPPHLYEYRNNIHLVLATSLLQASSKRTCRNPSHLQMTAISLLNRYADTASNEKQSPETLYNVGRAFHMIGIFSEACKWYRRCIDCTDNPRGEFVAEAAFNMHLIYLMHNQRKAAHNLLGKYCGST